MHNNNRHRVNLFSDIVATSLPRAKLALYVEISAIYKSSRRFHAKNCSLGRRRRASERHSERKRCGNMRHREAEQHKGEQRDKRVFVLRFYVVDSLVVTTMCGEILKSIVSTTTRRVAPRRAQYGTQGTKKLHRLPHDWPPLAGRCHSYCLLITTAVLWKHRDRSHCRV